MVAGMPRRDPVTLSDFTATRLDGADEPLLVHAGKVVLVVNVASKCGFTPQYPGLEKLWRDYRDRGFVVLGFPCNQFGGQEPGGPDDIAATCASYDVTFPVYARVDVNGPAADPLFAWLKHEAPGLLGLGAIKWNFTKFLIERDGRTVTRFAPNVEPASLAPEIDARL
jgi:glutathione peroxidase